MVVFSKTFQCCHRQVAPKVRIFCRNTFLEESTGLKLSIARCSIPKTALKTEEVFSLPNWLKATQIEKHCLLRHVIGSGGFRVGGPEARQKRGPSDDVIILSQP